MNLLSRFPYLTVCNHPLIQHKLTHMRDVRTSTKVFRELLREITLLMGYEMTKELPLTYRSISTPLVSMDSPVISGQKLVIVPVLRAGVGMSDGLLQLVPSARFGHIGIYRDDKHNAVEYFIKLPSTVDRTFILCDPMLATGHTIKHAVDVLIKRNIDLNRILLMTVVSSPEGLSYIYNLYPSLRIFTASVDDHLNEHAYIVPGLGDAGDRMFGTSVK